jgi:hypothetical protein
MRLVPIVVYLGVALPSTALEPWPGQIRYRTPIEAFLVAAMALAPSGIQVLRAKRRGR